MRLLDFNNIKNWYKKYNRFEITELIIFSNVNQYNYSRLGVIISKKVSKYAYKRNYIKRIIKEYFRLNQYFLHFRDFIFIIKPQIMKLKKNFLHILLKNIWYRYYK